MNDRNEDGGGKDGLKTPAGTPIPNPDNGSPFDLLSPDIILDAVQSAYDIKPDGTVDVTWEIDWDFGETGRRGILMGIVARFPLAIAAFVIGRELTIWFGAWVAARGRRVTELNREAQREYERTLEAGPQLHQG